MKQFTLILVLLFVAQPCFSMKKQLITIPKDFQFKAAPFNPESEALLKTKGAGNWELLEQNRILMPELFKTEDFYRKIKAQEVILTRLHDSLKKLEMLSSDSERVKVLVNFNSLLENQARSSLQKIETFYEEQNPAEGDYDYSYDPALQTLIAKLKETNQTLETRLISLSELACKHILNRHAAAAKVLSENYQLGFNVLNVIVKPESDPYHSIEKAIAELKMLGIVFDFQEKVTSYLLATSAFAEYFLPSHYEIQPLKDFSTLHAQCLSLKQQWEHLIKKQELLVVQKLKSIIKSNRERITLSHQFCEQALKSCEQSRSSLLYFQEKIKDSSAVSSDTKKCVRDTLASSEKLISAIENALLDKTSHIFQTFPLCELSTEVHIDETIALRIKQFKYSASFCIDPSYTTIYTIDDEKKVTKKLHFVSNNQEPINLKNIKQKKNSKKPFQEVQGISVIGLEEEKIPIKWDSSHDESNRLYHRGNSFYLYNAKIDPENVYLVENILHECEIMPDLISSASDSDQDQATDEREHQ